MTDVSASTSGGTDNYGVRNYNTSSPVMTSMSAQPSGGTVNYGVYNYHSSRNGDDPTAAITASGGTGNYGIYNFALLAVLTP